MEPADINPFMATLQLSLSGIRLTFGGTPLFDGVELAIAPGARIALVGRNGSGKSTLLKVAAGILEADGGERFVHPAATVRYLAQEPDASGYGAVGDYVAAGLGSERERRDAAALLDALQIASDATPATLSGGALRRAALAQALAGGPDILLLDEPTNHLDLPAIAWLEQKLVSMKSAIVVVSHDRRFLETVTTQTVWIDRGETRTLHQGFAAFEEWRDKILEEEEIALHKLGRKIAAEEDWMRYGVTARRKRNMRRLRELKTMRRKLRETRHAPGLANVSISQGQTSGKRVIVADEISKSFGARKIVDRFSIEIARGERIGIVGPNGAGKTTLLKLLTKTLAPDAGAVTHGANVQILSLDQGREQLQDDMRLADAITSGRGDWVVVAGVKRHVASYLKDFLFSPEQRRTPVGALSGGERGRLALAAAFAHPSNLLVLDEPTNDLDLETLDLLEDVLASYKGALLLVSHDRSFLDRIATAIVATDPATPGVWRRYAGGYDDMTAQRGRARNAAEKTAPARPAKTSTARVARAGAAQKLSYKEKYALETLPKDIAALQENIAAVKQTLADPALFQRDPALFEKSADALADMEAALAAAEDEWLRLEMKREALDRA